MLTVLPLLFTPIATATVPEIYGPGARLAGMGGGGAALVDDGAAAALNPSALTRATQPKLSLGFSSGIDHFDAIAPVWWDTNRDGLVNEADPALVVPADVPDAFGVQIQFARPIGKRFAVGLHAYMPTAYVVRLETYEPTLPTWFLYENRPQRYTMNAGAAAKIIPGVSVGAGIDFVPKARIDIALSLAATVDGELPEDATLADLLSGTVDVHRTNLDLLPGFAPIASVTLDVGEWVEPLSGLSFAANYRGSAGLPAVANLDLQADIAAQNIGSLDPIVLPLLLQADLSIFDHYVPPQLTVGAAWRSPKVSGYLDIRRTNWTKMTQSVSQVTAVHVTAPIIDIPDDAFVDGNPTAIELRATVGVRAGAEAAVATFGPDDSKTLLLRAGFSRDASPLVAQSEASALLDSARTAGTLGVGLRSDGKIPWTVDVYGQYHHLADGSLARSAATPTRGYPVDGDAIAYGGSLTGFGAQFGFAYR